MKAVNLTLNWEKCQIGLTELAFFGYLVSENGIGPPEERVRAVVEARQPENMHGLRSFPGLVNYSARFIPGFATISEPLRKLTRKDVPFVFGREQCTAFSVLKRKLTNAIKLAHFDKEAPTQVIADASPVGLGAVLVQDQSHGRVVVSYASRSLSDVERRYTHTEKEPLGLVWACEKFHPYIYGQCVELLTDHKPLEAYYGPKSKPCARIERWVLRLQPYEFNVIHLPGKNTIADPLSRLLKVDNSRNSVRWLRGACEIRCNQLHPKAMTIHDVERASSDDAELQQLRECIDTGRWTDCPDEIYAAISGEPCVIGQLVLSESRIVMPRKLRPQALALAHEGHLGIVGTKQALRSKVWWPGIYRAMETHCRSCHGCQLVARPDAPEPIRSTTFQWDRGWT